MYATTGTALAANTACTATDSTVGNILDLKYCYYTLSSGACQSSTTNNGNVIGATNNRDATRTQSFAYDQVNRIASGQTSSTTGSHCWGETYTLDQWANLTAIGAVSGYTGCTQENLSVSATANNQLSYTGFTYDAAGNMIADGTNSYGFNAESEITSAAGVNYVYDGDGNRVEKSNGKIYWYGAGSEILDESDLSGNITNEYVFFAGKRIAMSTNPVVQNASFETANGLSTQPCGSFNSGPIPAWTGTGAGSWAPCPSNYSSLPDGSVVAYSNGGTISQTLTNANFQPNTTYTLSVAVGHRADCCSPQNYTVALEAGSNVVASTNGSTGNITAGTFATVTVTYTTGTTPPSGNIGIALTAAGQQVSFDNVQLGISGSSSNNSIYFYVEDMLGSSRIIVADGQTTPCYDADFYPFGGERVITNTCTQNYKFEGKERDTETSNDDFGARYYSSRLGRWLSADWSSVPAPVPYANLLNPQTLNLYAMVADNPETFADLDGHQGAEEEADENPEEEAKDEEELAKALASVEANRQLAIANSPAAQSLSQSGYTDPLTGFCYNSSSSATSMSAGGPAPTVAPGASGPSGGGSGQSADFVVTPQGEAIPVPDGATSSPTRADGIQYQGGSGGKGMDDRVTGVRIMDANGNQGPRVSYNNASGQKVDPATGRTIPKSDPNAHIPLKPPPPPPKKDPGTP